ncbi:MAG: hypothetical protein RL726_668, partial [Actinomycetota bacterium]
MIRKSLALMVALASLGGIAACSSDDASPDSTTPEVGMPDPPIPSEVNAIPFTVGAVAAAGNAEVRMQLVSDPPVDDANVFVLDVWVKSGALE